MLFTFYISEQSSCILHTFSYVLHFLGFGYLHVVIQSNLGNRLRVDQP